MEPLSTGVAGLDEVMCGGLLPRSSHLIMGLPGTGKTVLAQQIGFHHARRGSNVLYLTALSETVEGLIGHARSLTFFEPSLVAQRLFYMSIHAELQSRGLSGVLEAIRRSVREYKPEVVLLDGLGTLKEAALDPLEFRRFVFTLDAQLSSLGATLVFISATESVEEAQPEATVADGIVVLYQRAIDARSARFIEVVKLRTLTHLMGRHSFIITADGLTVFPRLEAVMAAEGLPAKEEKGRRVGSGVAELDQLMSGGLPAGSITLVSGGPGVGKTLLGLSFLVEGARRGETGLYFGFHERTTRLMSKGDGVGLHLSEAVKAGKVRLLWHPLLEPLPDQLAWQLMAAIKDCSAERVVIDGLDDLLRTFFHRERCPTFIATLAHMLRGLGASAVLTSLPQESNCLELVPASNVISAAVDNIVVLRYVEVGAHLRRLVSILKMRDSEYDSTTYEFTISRRGIELTKPFDVMAKPAMANKTQGRRGR